MTQYKTCFTCKQTKPVSDFNKRVSRKDGYDSYCRECINRKKREYNAEHKEQVSAINRRSYLKNPQLFKDSAKRWQKANRDKAYKIARAYLAKNKGLANHYQGRRRAKIKESGVYYVRPSFLKRLYKSACIYCGGRDFIEADHLFPISKGGVHSEGNLVPACRSCNRAKHDDFLMEWRLKR
jgi:5-methylcytosine-specific restriction endonuclease McrA